MLDHGLLRRSARPAAPAGRIRARFRAALLAGLIILGGCSRRDDGAAGVGSGAAGPRATIERLLALRAAGRYQEMGPLILAEQRRAVTDTLLAIDDFLAANRQLGDYVRDHVGLNLADSVDQSHLGGSLDVFSRFVELLDETIDGDTARVAFTVDGQLPVRRAVLRLTAGAWQYDPGAGYSPALPQAFIKMARGLRRLREELAAGAIPAAALRDDPERLAREVQLRLMEGVRLLAPPPP